MMFVVSLHSSARAGNSLLTALEMSVIMTSCLSLFVIRFRIKMDPNTVAYIAKSVILKVEVGWCNVGGCGSDGAFFPCVFYFILFYF